MYLLDTNVVSELRKVRAGKADANVAAWSRTIPAASLFVSAITIHEIELGVLLMEGRCPSAIMDFIVAVQTQGRLRSRHHVFNGLQGTICQQAFPHFYAESLAFSPFHASPGSRAISLVRMLFAALP